MPFGRSQLGLLAGQAHEAADRQWAAGHQHVPVDPAEGELSDVVEVALLEQAQGTDAVGELPRQRLCVVVEVDEHGLLATGLDEAVRVTVELVSHLAACHELQEVVEEDVHLEVGYRPGLGCRDVVGVAEREDVGVGLRLLGELVDRDEVHIVAEP